MTHYTSPHPNLTAKFVPTDDPQTEDDSVALLDKDGAEVASVQIMSAFTYGMKADRYSATVEIEDGLFHMGKERATYAEAATDVVAVLVKHKGFEA